MCVASSKVNNSGTACGVGGMTGGIVVKDSWFGVVVRRQGWCGVIHE